MARALCWHPLALPCSEVSDCGGAGKQKVEDIHYCSSEDLNRKRVREGYEVAREHEGC